MNPDRITITADDVAKAYVRLHSARAAASTSPQTGTTGQQASRKAAHPAPISVAVVDTIRFVASATDRMETRVRRDAFGLGPAMRPDLRDRAGIRGGLPADAPDPRVLAALDWVAKAAQTIANSRVGDVTIADLQAMRRRALSALGESARAVKVREWPCPWCGIDSLVALPETGTVVCVYGQCPCREATGERFTHPVDEQLIRMIDHARKEAK